MMIFIFFLAKANPNLVIKERYKEFLSNIRDLAYTIVSDDSTRYGYYWARGYDAYRINVVNWDNGELKFSKYYLMKENMLYKIQYDPIRVDKEVSFFELDHLYGFNWTTFPLNYKWVKQDIISEFEFEIQGIKGSMFIDKDGRLKKIIIKHPGITYEIIYTNYVDLENFKYFPSEWDFIVGDEKKHFKIIDIFLNKGMCGPCTFKIPHQELKE